MRWPTTQVVSRLFLAATCAAAAACSGAPTDAETSDGAFTSNAGKGLEMRFKGEVIARKDDTARKAIATQMQYMQGALTSDSGGNAQAGMSGLSNIREIEEGDLKRITYEAALPVIWPNRQTVPETYAVVLPRDVTKLSAFNAKYDGSCGTNEYGRETFWHDFNPKAQGCTTDDADVMRATASVAPHPQQTQGKYPEYDKIWEDDTLDLVAVFGIISSNTPNDEGARTREQLLAETERSLTGATRTEGPETRGILKESTVSGKVTVGGRERKVNVTGVLVQEVSSAGSAFNERYAALTAKADVVIYEGHSGLGKNINALASNMGATAGKYQLVYLYGCQTLGYLGPAMHDKRIALNGADRDPEGTKFLDVIATGLPAYGDNGRSTLALYRAMLGADSPKTFNDLLGTISSLHLAVVFGEHDNTFAP